jgi:hypothetical protein
MFSLTVDDYRARGFPRLLFHSQRFSTRYIHLNPLAKSHNCFPQGSSYIRGPSDVISTINSMMGSAPFPCSEPHDLTFQIGGRFFPVDPRDFASQAPEGEGCVSNIVETDAPVLGGYLYSWNLGDPFLKG